MSVKMLNLLHRTAFLKFNAKPHMKIIGQNLELKQNRLLIILKKLQGNNIGKF